MLKLFITLIKNLSGKPKTDKEGDEGVSELSIRAQKAFKSKRVFDPQSSPFSVLPGLTPHFSLRRLTWEYVSFVCLF